MGSHGWQLFLIVGLVLVNAAFSGSEMALVSLRDGQLQRLARVSAGGRVLARLARDPNRFLATIQIGITLAGFLASAVAAVSLAEPLVPRLGLLHGWAEPAAIVLVTALTVFTLVVGERAPKRIARQHPEAWALATARPLSVLAAICRPAVWLLGAATNLVVLVAGADPHRSCQDVTTDEIHDLPDLDVHLPDTKTRGPYVTIAGLLLARLGHIPTQPGEHVTVGRYTADVTAVTRHAITQVRLHPIGDDHPNAVTPPRPALTALDHTRQR
jgi:CBS domain containing-hemolysin-like protein